MEHLHHAKRVPFQVPFLRGENPKELNRRRLCLRLFARAQRSPASSSHAFAHDAFRLSPKRVLPRRLLLFPKNLCVCKSFSGALLSRRETADTYRPPSSSFFTFSGTLFAWWGPKRIEQAQALPAPVRAREQIYLRRFAEAPEGKRQFAAKLCLVVARLRTRRVSPFSETRSPAAAPPLPKKSLRVQIFFGSPFIPKGNGRYLPSPFFVIFYLFRYPFCVVGAQKN